MDHWEGTWVCGDWPNKYSSASRLHHRHEFLLYRASFEWEKQRRENKAELCAMKFPLFAPPHLLARFAQLGPSKAHKKLVGAAQM